jgi:hypothetical protein
MTRTGSGETTRIREGKRFAQAAGLIFYILAAQGLLTAGVGVYVYLSGGGVQDLLLPGMGALLAACYANVGFHLRRYRLWARNFAFAFAAISLFALPVGTLLGSLIVLCVDRANRAGVFPLRRPAPAVPPAAIEENAPLLRLEPGLGLAREHVG